MKKIIFLKNLIKSNKLKRGELIKANKIINNYRLYGKINKKSESYIDRLKNRMDVSKNKVKTNKSCWKLSKNKDIKKIIRNVEKMDRKDRVCEINKCVKIILGENYFLKSGDSSNKKIIIGYENSNEEWQYKSLFKLLNSPY